MLPQILCSLIGLFRGIVGCPLADIRPHGDRRFQIPAPDQAIFRLVADLCNLLQRHIARRPQINGDVLYFRKILPVIILQPQLDINGPVSRIILCGRCPRKFRVQGLGHLLTGNAHGPQLILIEFQMHDLALFAPVEIDVLIIRVLSHPIGNLFRQFPHLVLVIAGHPQHHRISRRRSGLDELDIAPDPGELVRQFLFQPLTQFLA